MMDIKTDPQIEHGKTEAVNSIRYLGEIVYVDENLSKRQQQTHTLYKKKAISGQAELKHYNIVIKIGCPQAS